MAVTPPINPTRHGQLGQALAYVYFEEEQGGPVAISASPATRPGTPRILTAVHPLARTGEKVVAKENNTTGEQPKEKKTKRELEAMARQRLGCAVPVRRDAKDGDLADYFGSIPHAELLKSVARRIVDRRVLHLIKMWPECP